MKIWGFQPNSECITSVADVTDSAPVLIVGFNRPDHLANTIRALANSAPQSVLLAIDGPRTGNSVDIEKCRASQNCVNLISWPCSIQTRFRTQNLGIRYAVTDAVSWAIDLFGRVIVLEDDAEPGPEAIPYANAMLRHHAVNRHIGHISLYNVVPEKHMTRSQQPTRLSRYPESYAWATWQRAWKYYDDDLSWLSDEASFERLSQDLSTWRLRKWMQNFRDARASRIDTWAYRWIAALWRHQLLCLSPNRNLVRYTGQQHGTHTRRRQRWSELNVSSLPAPTSEPMYLDTMADNWLARNIFRETASGYLEGLAVSSALTILGTIRH